MVDAYERGSQREIRLKFFLLFGMGNMFGMKDPIPGELRSRVAYKFACVGCNACYVGETV